MDHSELYRAPRGLPEARRGPESFVRLRGRTTATAVALVFVTVYSVAMEATRIVEVESRGRGSSTLGAVSALALLGFFAASIAAAILVGVWVYRAARNLRALGRDGMRFSPALAVVSFYVPLINLVLPIFALSELRRASEPGQQSEGRGWKSAGSGRGLVTLWWASWITSSLAMWTSLQPYDRGTTPPSIVISAALASALMVVASYASIRVMKDVDARQEAVAAASAAADPSLVAAL
jgi:hypothetical protein